MTLLLILAAWFLLAVVVGVLAGTAIRIAEEKNDVR